MKRLIYGLVAALFCFQVALADGLTGTVTPQGGGGINLSFNGGISSNGSFIPLAGSAVDMSFSTGQYYGGTLANLISTTRAQTVSSYAQTAAGALVPFAADTPRITNLGLLIEEARTNLCLQSQTFNIATWTGGSSGVTLADNQTTAPDVTSTAGLSTDTTANSTHFLSEGSLTYTSGTAVTLSVYVKAGTARYIFMRGDNNAGSQTWVTLDTQTGTILTTGSPASPFVTPLGNGWFRFGMTNTPNASFGGSIVIGVGQTSNVSSLVTYVGTSQSYYVWGVQFEVGAFATSYTPTTTVSVTRAADLITSTGALLTLLSAAQGTVIAQVGPYPGGATQPSNQGGAIFGSSSSTLQRYPFNNTDLQTYNGGTGLRVNIGGAAFASNIKAGVAWSGAGRSIAGNNVLATDANTISSPSQYIGSANTTAQLDGYIRRFTGFSTRLADAALQALTQ